jgi:hypothetical protein
MSFVDGNDLAGPMREVFAVDMTVALGRCGSCGRTGPLAEARVYDRAPGLVARCIECEEILMRVVRGPDRVWLDLRGVSVLEIPLPAADA